MAADRVIGRLVAIIDGDLTGLQKAVSGAEKELRNAGRRMTDAGKALSIGVTAPIVGLGAVTAKAAIEFESAFAGVRKTVDATSEQFNALNKGIRDMAKNMPASATEIAHVAEAAGQLGVKTEDILRFTETMIKLAATTNLTSDQAATAMARFANIMQTPADKIANVASALVKLGNAGASTESEILDMALRLAGAGRQIGLTEDQVLAFANALSSVGIEAEAGGSAFSRVFINIASAVADGGDKLAGFARVAGMSADEFAQKFRTDAAGAILAFIEGLARMSAAGDNVFQTLDDLDLGELRVRDSLLRAAGAGDVFRQSLADGAAAIQSTAALDEEFAKRKATTAAQLEILRNRLMDVAITLGNALIPSLLASLPAVQGVLMAVAKIAQVFAELPRPVQSTIIVLALLAASIGPVLLALGSMSSGLAAVIRLAILVGPAFSGLTTIGPMVAAVGASLSGLVPIIASLGAALLTPPLGFVVALAAAGVAAYIFRDQIADAMGKVYEVVVGALGSILDFIKANWRDIAPMIAGPFLPVVALATDAFGIRSALLGALGSILGAINALIEPVARQAQAFGEAIYYGIRAGVNGAIDAINYLIQAWNQFRIATPEIKVAGQTIIPSISFDSPDIPKIPKLASGMPYVPEDMLAYIHRGEMVVPRLEADQMRKGGSGYGAASLTNYGPVTVINQGARQDAGRGLGSLGYAWASEWRRRGVVV